MNKFFVPLFISSFLLAQPQGTWKKTNFVPSPSSRNNDGFFLNEHVGWIANGVGQIHRTTTGGQTWVKVIDKTSKTHWRSIGFFDSSTGYAGALGWGDPNNMSATDTVILYKSTNGGTNWFPEHQLSSGTIKRGFCGMQIFSDSIINAVGRVRGPAWFYRTTDRGTTWIAKDMNQYAAGLIDVYFFTKDTGFCVGLTHATHDSSSGVVLMTTDGGNTWTKKITTSRKGEWCWKIQFPSRNIGYASLQRNSLSPIYFLKTTDGGNTWTEKLFSNSYYFVQGMGFINDTLGWIGGYSSILMYQTTNGGESWSPLGIGRRVNRFRFLSPTLAYAVGDSVYKYSVSSTGFAERSVQQPDGFELSPNFPNPFNPNTTIRFKLAADGLTTIHIYDSKGSLIRTLLHSELKAGSYSLSWDGRNEADEDVASGVYMYRLQTNDFDETKKMILVR
ncbi:MAG: T9SS type A sorting domain-containing protein [Bacteroidota bacterium]